jgi:hypothetical protein
MIKIKVGSKFERRTKRGVTHNLIVLHDTNLNKRVLFNTDLEVHQGTLILLHCHYVGDATKEEIEKYSNILNEKQTKTMKSWSIRFVK